MKKTSINHLGSFWAGLLSFFLSGKNANKIEKIEYEKLQEAIKREDKANILEEIIKFINNGCRCTIVVVAQKFIDFDNTYTPDLSFEKQKTTQRTGVTDKVLFLPQRFKAIHKLREGESGIDGLEFIDRLKNDPDVTIVNYNMIDFLYENQDEADVKEFLDQYRGKALFAFGDIIKNEQGPDKARYIYAPTGNGRWEKNSRDLGGRFDKLPPCFWALVMNSK